MVVPASGSLLGYRWASVTQLAEKRSPRAANWRALMRVVIDELMSSKIGLGVNTAWVPPNGATPAAAGLESAGCSTNPRSVRRGS